MSTEWEAGDISRKARTQPHWPRGPGQGLALIVKRAGLPEGLGEHIPLTLAMWRLARSIIFPVTWGYSNSQK